MANHVSNRIVISNINNDILDEVNRIFKKAEGEYEVGTEELAKRVFGEDAPEEYDRGWYCDNCGAKWMHGYAELEEYDGMDEICIEITSAWDSINGWVYRLFQNLSKINESVIIMNTFEDEGYNFAGVYYTSKEHEDECEWIDMDEHDVNIMFGDDVEQSEIANDKFYDAMYELEKSHKECHLRIIEDMKLNPENYE